MVLKIAKWLREFAVVLENLSSGPNIHGEYLIKLPVTSASEVRIPSSGLQRHLHILCTHTHTHDYTDIHTCT